jgi:glycosyltransferase involved in cell wall biosynthesis
MSEPRVSVITPTIPERAALLEECKASVDAQTLDGYEHVIMFDRFHDGCAKTTNAAAKAAKGEWLLPLADDDLLLPGAISNLLAATCDADIVYSPPLVTGNEDRWWFYQAPPVIPSTALIRASLWNELGGYDENLDHEEDRDLWTKALDAGARFVRVDAPTWIYRQHDHNKSFNKAVAA